MNRLTSANRVALLMHDVLGSYSGKMGHGFLRYGVSPVVVVIDKSNHGRSLMDVTDIPLDVPIVPTIEDALPYDPDVLMPGISPAGGMLPEEWASEIEKGLAAGLSIVHGFHTQLGTLPQFTRYITKPGQFIWDIRREPDNLVSGSGKAREVHARRILFVGTDMNSGKMTAAIEMDRAARSRGLRSRFLATGQTGIAIAGGGVALDAVRIDYATGAVESLVVSNANDQDYLFIEGQGSLLHPASSATLSLIRGAVPTHLILVHRAHQTSVKRAPWVAIPTLREVIQLHEWVCTAGGALPPAKVVAIALNTAHLTSEDATKIMAEVEQETNLPVSDVVRFGANRLLDAVISN